jgi:hypothetical protein
MKQILTRFGERKALCEIFEVTMPTVRSALAGSSRTKLAKRIRKAAIERGGMEVESEKMN